jgi:hypothetical protein
VGPHKAQAQVQEAKEPLGTEGGDHLMWVEDMPHAYFQKLSASMPRRLKLVLKSKGDMTKYNFFLPGNIFFA